MLVTSCAYIMRGFGSLSLRLNRISKTSARCRLKLIALLLSFPTFKISHFSFKLAYSLNQSRAFFICREHAALGFKDSALQFDNLGLNGRPIVQILHRLRDIHSGIERGKKRRLSTLNQAWLSLLDRLARSRIAMKGPGVFGPALSLCMASATTAHLG